MEVEIPKSSCKFRDFQLEYNEFPEISNDLSYDEFFNNFFVKNQACLIKSVANNWESSKYWIKNKLPNFLYLKQRYGNLPINVVDCKAQTGYGNEKSLKWKFKDYIEYWQGYNESDENLPLFYLKDWHLQNEVPVNNIYEIPLYFACDWLNEYLVEHSLDDYRFVYMGVRGTWSPFHVDVMTSYSWSTNLCGQKKWILFPPGEEKHITDKFGNIPNDITELKHKVKYFEVIQNAGDAIFVPSNWHHQVWNIQDTISINHNWINGCNLHIVWQSMKKELQKIIKEIEDCKDMENFLDHCQVMLKASFNLNIKELFSIMNYIAQKRLTFLNGGPSIQLTEKYTLGTNHSLFDLLAIKLTLTDLINYADLNSLSSFNNLKDKPLDLLTDLKNIDFTSVNFIINF